MCEISSLHSCVEHSNGSIVRRLKIQYSQLFPSIAQRFIHPVGHSQCDCTHNSRESYAAETKIITYSNNLTDILYVPQGVGQLQLVDYDIWCFFGVLRSP